MATRRPSEPTRSSKDAAPVRAKSSSTPPAASTASAASRAKPTRIPAPSTPPKSTAAAKVTAPKRAAKLKGAAAPRAEVSPDKRRAMIAEAAYLRAERRGFAPGHEAEDWCAAEREVDALLSAGTSAAPPQ